MTAPDPPSRLRLFRDGRFVEDEPAGAPATPPPPHATPPPLLAPDSLASRVVGYGCLAVVVLPMLLVALIAGLFALAAGLDDERTSTTGVIRSIAPGTDDDGVPRDHCYEVAYTAGGRERVHRTCEVLPRAAADVPDDETRAQRDERFAATHVVGSEVRLRHAHEPPYAARGAIADTDVTLLEPTTGAVIGVLIAGSALSVAGLALWLGLRGRRRRAG